MQGYQPIVSELVYIQVLAWNMLIRGCTVAFTDERYGPIDG